MILADVGYRDGGEFFETSTAFNTRDQAMKKVARTRHEGLKNLKLWKIATEVS